MSEAKTWIVAYYKDESGNLPVEQFVDELDASARAKIDRHLDWLKQFGVDLDMPQAKHLKGKLWELRPGDCRVLYYLAENQRFILLHAFRKTTDKTPKGEMVIAENRMEDHESRTKKGQAKR
jgi:phage-related protein